MSSDMLLRTTRSRRGALALIAGAVLGLPAARTSLANHDGT